MTVLLSATVMAHPLRREQAEHLAGVLGARVVWDRYNDEWDTGSRALADFGASATHHLVIQDDAVPIAGFYRQAVHALEQHPASPVSFYLGRSRPPRYQRRIIQATLRADETGAAWISANEMLHGVAIALPVADIPTLLAWSMERREPYDERIGMFYRDRGRDVLYTWPSLVDHADGDTLVRHRDGQPRAEQRIAWRTGIPTSWNTLAEAL